MPLILKGKFPPGSPSGSPSFRLPDAANYCLCFTVGKQPFFWELFPVFAELFLPSREKWVNGARTGEIREVLPAEGWIRPMTGGVDR